jgi:hypothetical protein
VTAIDCYLTVVFETHAKIAGGAGALKNTPLEMRESG